MPTGTRCGAPPYHKAWLNLRLAIDRIQRVSTSPARRRRLFRHILVAGAAALACGDGPEAVVPGAIPAGEALDPPAAERVVSLTSLGSRFAIALGAAHRLVGVDATSAQLPDLAGLPVVDLPGAVDLRPDLVLLDARSRRRRPRSAGAERPGRRARRVRPARLRGRPRRCAGASADAWSARLRALRFEARSLASARGDRRRVVRSPAPARARGGRLRSAASWPAATASRPT